MQIDVDPQEDPQNAPDVNYVVENPTLVGIFLRGGLPSLGSVGSTVVDSFGRWRRLAATLVTSFGATKLGFHVPACVGFSGSFKTLHRLIGNTSVKVCFQPTRFFICSHPNFHHLAGVPVFLLSSAELDPKVLNPHQWPLPRIWDSSQFCRPKGRFGIRAQAVRSLLTYSPHPPPGPGAVCSQLQRPDAH